MIVSLRIRNLAIVRELELEFGAGLNVITGETGSGKSIVVTALGLALGARASAGLVRNGCEQSEVEALFHSSASEPLRARLQSCGLEEPGNDVELVLRRVVSPNGRARSYVNGRLVTSAQLRDLALLLSDICSQHEHHRLSDARTHLSFLDAYGKLNPLRLSLAELVERLRSARGQEARLALRLKDRALRLTGLDDAIAELEGASLRSGEDAELEALAVRLKHRASLERLIGRAAELLFLREETLVDQVALVAQAVREASLFDETLKPTSDELLVCQQEIEAASRAIRRYQDREQTIATNLEQVEERLYALSKLKRRYGGSVESALEQLVCLQAERRELQALDETSPVLRAEVAELEQKIARKAAELSHARRGAAQRLALRIERELRGLGMPHAEAKLVLQALDAADGGLMVSDTRVNENGAERAEIELTANPGQPARSLCAIASGGELSRVLLAVQCALADAGSKGLIVFDEVDTGVGGAIAEVIGRKIRAVSNHAQVVCVTHLAPVAVFADRHFRVKKSVLDGSTQSDVVRLSASEQTEEVARMLGGIRITKSVRAAARELLRDARRSAA